MSTLLTFNIISRYDGAGVRQARQDINNLDDSSKKSTNSLNSWAGRLTLGAQAAAAFGPALIPIGTSMAGVGAAALAMGVSVGTGVGVYAAALQGATGLANSHSAAVKKSSAELDRQKAALAGLTPGTQAYSDQLKVVEAAQEKYNKSLAAFTPEEKKYTTSVTNMKTAWEKLVASTEKDTLKPASTAIDAIAGSIGKLKPLLDALGPIAQKVANDFKKWTEDGGLDRFIKTVITNGVPALNNLVAAGRSVLSVLGTAFRTLAPEGLKLSTAIKQGADALKGWADGGGFTRFLDKVHEVAPSVKQFFSDLGRAAKNVFDAMNGLGPLSLGFVDVLLKLVANTPVPVLQAIAIAFVSIRIAMTGMMIINAIATGFRAAAAAWFILNLAFSASVIGIIIIALIALGVAIYELVTHWSTVWAALKTAANAVGQWFAGPFVNFFLAVGRWFSGPFVGFFLAIGRWFSGPFVGFFLAVGQWFSGPFVNFFVSAWHAIQSAFTTVGNALKTAWNAVWNALKTAATTVWNWMKTAWNAVVHGFQTAWTTVGNALKTAWNTVWNGLKTAANTVWNWMKTAWTTVLNGLRTAWTTVGNALRTAWQTVWNAIKTAANTVWNWMKTAWTATLNALKTAWTTVSNALKTAWQTVWNAMKTAANTIWQWMKTTWNAIINAMKTAWDTVSGALKTAWSAVWNWIKDTASKIWDEAKKLWTDFTNAINTLWNTASGILKTAWSETWNTLKSTASSIWNEIKGVISDAVNFIIDVINGLIGAWNAVAGAVGLPTIGTIGHVGGGGGGGGGGQTGGTIALRGAQPSSGTGPGGVPGFAEGGIVNFSNGGVAPGYAPGVDSVHAMVSPGEGILVPEAVQGLGADFVLNANAHFSGGRAGASSGGFGRNAHFAEGGIMGRMPHFAGGGFVTEIPTPGGGTVGQTPGQNLSNTGKDTGPGNSLGALIPSIPGLPSIAEVTASFMQWINKANSIPWGWAQGMGSKAAGLGMQMLQKVIQAIQAKIQSMMSSLLGKVGLGGLGGALSGKVSNLSDIALKALLQAGIPASQLQNFLTRIQIESSGNPNAVNNWDINARNGTPSMGLAQITTTNFAKFGSGNILNPQDNLNASANYIKAVYGGRVPTGAAYAGGTAGANNGWAMVGEQGPEVINFRGGESVMSAHELARAYRDGGGGNVHVEMPIHVAGNLDKHAVEKLDTEVLPKLRIMLSKGTGTRLR